MKKMILISLTLAFASLACLQSAAVNEFKDGECPDLLAPELCLTPVATASEFEAPAGAVYELPEIIETVQPRMCAVVIAEESLHLRGGPGEGDIVLTWLLNGEVVQVIDQGDSEWWRIERGGVVGFARSVYLEESECVK